MHRAVNRREQARITLHDAIVDLNSHFPNEPAKPRWEGWTVRTSVTSSRLDSAFHDQHVRNLRSALLGAGGVTLGSIASIKKPAGRYKTYYVGTDNGTPLLSGRQILQLDVVAAKNISSRSVPADSGYELRPGWICFQADGRAEESLGYPVVVTAERDGWFASGHVGRAIPDEMTDSGWLWAAMACD